MSVKYQNAACKLALELAMGRDPEYKTTMGCPIEESTQHLEAYGNIVTEPTDLGRIQRACRRSRAAAAAAPAATRPHRAPAALPPPAEKLALDMYTTRAAFVSDVWLECANFTAYHRSANAAGAAPRGAEGRFAALAERLWADFVAAWLHLGLELPTQRSTRPRSPRPRRPASATRCRSPPTHPSARR